MVHTCAGTRSLQTEYSYAAEAQSAYSSNRFVFTFTDTADPSDTADSSDTADPSASAALDAIFRAIHD